MIIMRLMGDAPRTMLVAPTWSQDKQAAIQYIERELQRRNTYQGKRVPAY
jgi:radical SAM superfamily enzyme